MRYGFLLPAFLILLSGGPSLAQDAAPPAWNVSVTQSALGFTATQMGKPFSGHVGKFSAEIIFDPDRLAESRVSVEADLASISTGDSDRDRTLALPEWFDLGNYATARFVAGAFTKREDGKYEASGTLTIKDKAVPVVMTFTLDISPGAEARRAQVKGVATLNRADFGLGTGEWADVSVIANEVTVTADIVAHQKNSSK